MQCHQLAAGLILCFLVVCHPKVAEAQFPNAFYPQRNGFGRQAPRSGSFSRINNNAYQREVDLGAVDLTRGVSNTRAVTSSNGGFRNGGTTSIADRNSVSRGINLGGIDIGSTLTRTQTRTNGEVSRGLAHDLNIGNLGIGTSLSRENLRRGFGLQRDDDGRLSLGLGLLNIGLTPNAQQQTTALSQAQVNAQGENAQARANSQTQTQQQNYGNVGVKETRTHSNAVGRSQFGQTRTNFFGGGNFFGGRNFDRVRRSLSSDSGAIVQLLRPKLHTEFTDNNREGIFPDGNSQRTQSNSKSQSLYLEVDGHTADALTESQTLSVKDTNAFVSNSAPSNASTSNRNGVNEAASATSQAGNGANNAYKNALTNGGFLRREQKLPYGIDIRKPRPTFLTHPHQDNSHPDKQQPPEATELLDLNRPMHTNASARQTFSATLPYDYLYPNPQPRTVNTILDFITNLFSGCVSPCTLEAYYNNKCCNISVPALPPVLPQATCCQGQQYPYTPIIAPQPFYGSQQYPINCCSICNSHSYYGPPPCIRYSTGGYYGGRPAGAVGGTGLSFGAGTQFGSAGVSLSVPPLYG